MTTTHIGVNIHTTAETTFAYKVYESHHVGPWVAIDIGDESNLYVHDPDVLTRLIDTAIEARRDLIAARARRDAS